MLLPRTSIRFLHAFAACVIGVVAVCPAGLSAAEAQPQQQQLIDQYAKSLEPRLPVFVDGELELVKGSCGSLSPAARREIFAAGKAAVPSAARQLATFWVGGQQGKPFDAKRSVQDAIHAAVKPHATTEEFAAYERARAARLARRGHAARASIVARLDRKLQLTIKQRAAITAALEQGWEEDWNRELTDRNFDGLAPDRADRCIAPHLDPRQRAAWDAWRQQAGWSRAPEALNPFPASVIPHEPDPWWTP